MPLLLRNLALDLDEPEDELLERAASRLRIPRKKIGVYGVARRAIDARRSRVCFAYSVELNLLGGPEYEQALVQRLNRSDVTLLRRQNPPPIEPGTEPLPHAPVVVGFGPAGMFSALALAEAGYRPIVLERGPDVATRTHDIVSDYYRRGQFHPESNLLFGEGGAGTYSDGKLYTRVGDLRGQQVLETLVRHGAKPQILIDSHPHIGSDRLPSICRRMRRRIEGLGGRVLFGHHVVGLTIHDGSLVGLSVAGRSPIDVGPTILAIGHSARDTYRALHDAGVPLAAKPFQLGLRVEHAQEQVDRWQYGRHCGHPRLPSAYYRLVAKGVAGGRDVYSFCMCPGGMVLPAHEAPEALSVNGASNSRRDSGFANSGLVATLDTAYFGNDPLQGVAMQQRLERAAFDLGGGHYRAATQRAADFVAGRPSGGAMISTYPLGTVWADLHQLLPPEIDEALAAALGTFDAAMPGFAGPEAILFGPESRASGPVRILRDPHSMQSPAVACLYPVGEGAGYAGGIVSAAIDGLRAAEAVIARYRPPD